MPIIKITNQLLAQFVVDGFEHEIRSSQDTNIKNVNFSGKKKMHSFTQLLLTTTSGWICYVSPSYSGSVNDLNLTSFPETNMKDKLFKGCSIIGDLGFRGATGKGKLQWITLIKKIKTLLKKLEV